jgi:hypothetical protein
MLRRDDDARELVIIEFEDDRRAPTLQHQEVLAAVKLPLTDGQGQRDGGAGRADAANPDPRIIRNDGRPDLRTLHREVLSPQGQRLLGSRQSDLETVRVKVKGRHASSLPVICREWDGDSSQRHNGHVDGQA